jgi:hypothetical protein
VLINALAGQVMNGATLDPLARLLVCPFVPQASHHHVAFVSHRDGVRLLLRLLPFIEAVSHKRQDEGV